MSTINFKKKIWKDNIQQGATQVRSVVSWEHWVAYIVFSGHLWTTRCSFSYFTSLFLEESNNTEARRGRGRGRKRQVRKIERTRPSARDRSIFPWKWLVRSSRTSNLLKRLWGLPVHVGNGGEQHLRYHWHHLMYCAGRIRPCIKISQL